MTLIISFLSAIVAAFLAHYLATFRLKLGDLSKFQVEAYSDFIAAASRLAVSRRHGDSSNKDVDLGALNDAKSRIIVCGHPGVVAALIEFWEKGETLEREPEILAFKRLTQVMRHSVGHRKHDIHELRVSDALFRLEPSEYSVRGKRRILWRTKRCL